MEDCDDVDDVWPFAMEVGVGTDVAVRGGVHGRQARKRWGWRAIRQRAASKARSKSLDNPGQINS
jgi:hypothetical protein